MCSSQHRHLKENLLSIYRMEVESLWIVYYVSLPCWYCGDHISIFPQHFSKRYIFPQHNIHETVIYPPQPPSLPVGGFCLDLKENPYCVSEVESWDYFHQENLYSSHSGCDRLSVPLSLSNGCVCVWGVGSDLYHMKTHLCTFYNVHL